MKKELLKRIEELLKRIEYLEQQLLERDAEIARLNGIILLQNEKIAKLEAKLNTNSSNSSKPPSSDPLWKEPKKSSKGSGKNKQGAQPGHTGVTRELVQVEEVDSVVRCEPTKSCPCGGDVVLNESNPERKQVYDIPKIEPIITEYQIFSGCCSACSAKIRGNLPLGTPLGMLGPNALATIAYFTGSLNLSKRDIEELFNDYFNISICTGTVCNAEQQVSEALEVPYNGAVAEIKNSPIVGADETSHRVAGATAWMWIAATCILAVFFARAKRTKKVAQEILGEAFSGILISDRYSAYLWVSRRQLCWAHLCRDFNKLKDLGGLAADFANPILGYIKEMFSLWHKFKDGEITRSELKKQVQPICEKIEERLEQGKTIPCAQALSKSLCSLKHGLWTFIHNEGVEPTNNDSERTVRKYVVWRKTSFGTQGEKGNQYVERILTVVGTCKRQDRSVFGYLSERVANHLQGIAGPSLIPNQTI